MADHGELEYATAEGNDVPAHEAAYESFTHFVVIGTVLVITIVVGLAIGGVLGHWLLAAATVIAGCIAAGHRRMDGIALAGRRRAGAVAPRASVLRPRLTSGTAGSPSRFSEGDGDYAHFCCA